MYCPNCGTRLEDNAKFCLNCGTDLRAAGAVSYNGNAPEAGGSPEVPAEPRNPQQSRSYDPKVYGAVPSGNHVKQGMGAGAVILVVAALALVLIGGGILLVRTLSGDKDADTASAESTSGLFASGTQNAGENAAGAETGTVDGTADAVNGGNVDAAGPGQSPQEAGAVLAENAQNTENAGGSGSGAPHVTPLPIPEIVQSQSARAQEIAELNAGGAQNADRIDIYAENYTPVRNKSLAWNNSLFYTLEDVYPDRYDDGQINGYLVSRKSFIAVHSGNTVEYEIYTNPGTGKVNKIVSIEYIGDHLEITDYYYLDSGKVNFIFVRTDYNYVPSYAVPEKDGERYYFNDDCLVKWRIVSGGSMNNYCIGSNSLEENHLGNEIAYDSMDAGSKAAYDAAEIRMLNAAYNTYNQVLSAGSVNRITGFVYNIDESVRTDAEVWLFQGDEYLYSCHPDQTGAYTIIVPAENTSYSLEIVAPGCERIVVWDISISIDVVYTYVDTVYAVNWQETPYQQTLCVRDALNYAPDGVSMMPVGGAEVHIRRGFNARATEIIAQGTTDAEGNLYITLIPGIYTAEVIKSGYDVICVNIVVRIDSGTVEIHFSPSLPEGEMRIVLSWGQYPEDLDSHLFTPYDSAMGDSGYHIFYSNQHDAVGDNLDVDDTDSYGPETITIPVVKNGLYKYYVVDYTNCSRSNPGSYDMSNSGATVNVYASNGLAATFYVPANQPGVIWEVFEIRNGQIIPNQRYYSNISGTDWWHR